MSKAIERFQRVRRYDHNNAQTYVRFAGRKHSTLIHLLKSRSNSQYSVKNLTKLKGWIVYCSNLKPVKEFIGDMPREPKNDPDAETPKALAQSNAEGWAVNVGVPLTGAIAGVCAARGGGGGIGDAYIGIIGGGI
jgi:hypothetical protein